MFPAAEKIRSDGVDVAGMQRKDLAIFDRNSDTVTLKLPFFCRFLELFSCFNSKDFNSALNLNPLFSRHKLEFPKSWI
ncbi:uncharacterized [Tachysurus ichikawai]